MGSVAAVRRKGIYSYPQTLTRYDPTIFLFNTQYSRPIPVSAAPFPSRLNLSHGSSTTPPNILRLETVRAAAA